MTLPGCFKAYDIRGRVPKDLDADLSRRIGRATATFLGGNVFALGRDVRHSSPDIAAAVAAGLNDVGLEVRDLGLCGTEQVYHAVSSGDLDGGVMVTASHNPLGWNGLKIVRRDSRPVSGDTGLFEIGRLAVGDQPDPLMARGVTMPWDHTDAYIDFLCGFIDPTQLAHCKLVVNAGNGCAGLIIDRIAERLPCELIRIHHEPDGSFPNGVPNPLLPENRAATAKAVRDSGADLGLAWDGDFDRCFFFDENGNFVEGYYMVGLLARAALRANPGGRIVHDPRLIWNTVEVVRKAGGVPLVNKTGHAFIKERMRAEDAVYGGEMSAHHYFRDFAYCDSGMIPWLLVLQEMNAMDRSLAQLVGDMQAAYPASGEINLSLDDPEGALAAAQRKYGDDEATIDHTDGLSVAFADWRFNLRPSNTEPVVRLNVESRGDAELMRRRSDELVAWLKKGP